jgi:chromosomal replication initiation ATPase DnaA
MSELFLTGGRRSGKTFLMEAILCSYAVAVPDSIVWTVVPSEKFIEEPRKVGGFAADGGPPTG